jgi:formylglycine-generating enzyme required for sulfatase activity
LAALSPRDTGSAGGSSPANGYRSVPLTEVEEKRVTKLVNWGIYNPLEDTRPFYYASYNAVRSARDLYSSPPAEATTKGYIMSANGDEFQLIEHPSTPMSFMDILNSKVVVQTQTRIYGVNTGYEGDGRGGPDRSDQTWAKGNYYNTLWWENKLGDGLSVSGYEAKANGFANGKYDKYGGSPLMQYLMDARDNKQGLTKTTWRKKRWSSGVTGGINFDLPTEAQWEYCCRVGSAYAIPPWYNLAENFEERDDNLDLIAWYKYKVIGSLPEPERFCAWRISKMLFGISKDKEQINNVYETTY